RRLHFAGTLLVLLTLGGVLATQRWVFLWLLPLFGYGLAWLGHFAVDRNRPATFRHPLYSLIGDFRMFADMLRGRVPFCIDPQRASMADRGRRARARRPGRSAAPSESAGRHGSSAELGAVGVRLRAAHVLADADDHAAGRRAGLAGPEFLRAIHARHARQCRPVCRSRRPDVA